MSSQLKQSRRKAVKWREHSLVSVVASWRGHCRDHSVQAELVAYLIELAAFNKALVAPDESVERIDRQFGTPVLLEPGLLPASHAGTRDDGLGEIAALTLFGVSFEPRFFARRYAGHSTIDFVFIRKADDPALDGKLVRLIREEDLMRYDHEAVRTARSYVASPSIHLRYDYETWLDELMAWVRRFFVEDLEYWRYEDRLVEQGYAFCPEDDDLRSRQWAALKLAYVLETAKHDLPELARAALASSDIPWAWIVERLLAFPQAIRLSAAVCAIVPHDRWLDLRRESAIAILQRGYGANLEYMPFSFANQVFALSSSMKSNGLTVDVDVAPPVPPQRIITTTSPASVQPRPARAHDNKKKARSSRSS
jgi:hypothetical protein